MAEAPEGAQRGCLAGDGEASGAPLEIAAAPRKSEVSTWSKPTGGGDIEAAGATGAAAAGANGAGAPAAAGAPVFALPRAPDPA